MQQLTFFCIIHISLLQCAAVCTPIAALFAADSRNHAAARVQSSASNKRARRWNKIHIQNDPGPPPQDATILGLRLAAKIASSVEQAPAEAPRQGALVSFAEAEEPAYAFLPSGGSQATETASAAEQLTVQSEGYYQYKGKTYRTSTHREVNASWAIEDIQEYSKHLMDTAPDYHPEHNILYNSVMDCIYMM
jgi:hypothetical protein